MANQGTINNLKQNIDDNIYQNTLKEITGEKMNNVLQNVVDTFDYLECDFFNVNSKLGTPATYYTLQQAINAIPEAKRFPLMTICYRTDENNYEFAQYVRSAVADTYFLDTAMWKVLFTTKTLGEIEKNKGFTNVQIYNNTSSGYASLVAAATTINFYDRRIGHIITYRDATDATIWHTFQFKYSDISNTYWLDSDSWIEINATSTATVINVNNYANNIGFYTLTTAIAAIGSNDRMPGQIIIFKQQAQVWKVYKFRGGTLEVYSDEQYWDDITEGYLRFSVLGGINKTTGKKIIGSNYYCTPYLKAEPGITIRGFEGSAIAMVTFFDMFFNYISALTLQAGTYHRVTLTAQDIPANAVYFRASGQLGTETGFITGYGGSAIDDVAVWLWQSSDLQDFTEYLTRGKMYAIGNISIGDTATMSDNSQVECAAIQCNQGDKFQISGSGGVGPRLWGWCDVDMKLISRADASITESNLTLVAPANAKYFIYNNIFAYATAVLDKDNRIASNTEVPKSNWMALGDSITQGYYSDDIDPYYHLDPSKGWTNWVKRITGKNLINNAIGGTGFACKGPQGTSICGRELVDQLISQNAFDNVDLVTIAYGVNDWKYNYVLGDMTDTVDASATKIIPSMRYVIERIIYANPNIKIIGIMPINCKVGGNYAGNWGIGYAFTNNGTLQQIYEAFKEVYDYYGIEYIDMLHSSIVNRNNIGETLLDNVHPSVKAHEVMGRELAMKINCY